MIKFVTIHLVRNEYNNNCKEQHTSIRDRVTGKEVIMTRIDLFKNNDNLNTMLSLQNELIMSKLFKLPDGKNEKFRLTKDSNIETQDRMIVESNVDEFITVWTRHERKGKKRAEKASYGIRVKTGLYDIPSMKVLIGNIDTSFNDDKEFRIVCYSANDVKFLVTKILSYQQAHVVNRKSKEIATAESVTA